MRSCGEKERRRGVPGDRALAIALAGWLLVSAVHAQAPDANLYKEALTREAALRVDLAELRAGDPGEAVLQRIRVMVGAYEDIAQLFPSGDYGDNALWQGGVLSADVFLRFGDVADRDAALRLLNTLVASFPSSPFTAKVPAQVARVGRSGQVPARQTVPPADGALLRGIKQQLLPQVVRITLDLDRETVYTDERATDPPRAFIDLLNTRVADSLRDSTIPINDAVVTRLRVVSPAAGRARLVFELASETRFSVYALYNPYRVVVDFERRTVKGGRQAPTDRVPAPPRPNAGGGFSLSRQLGLRVTRVVVDPGHGGHDPGTQVPGLTEAGLVLDVAQRVEQLLKNEEDVDVILTRRSNTYVSLEDRTAIANRSEADLFLSIHANANATAGVRGVETYFLDFAVNPEAEALAARENAASSRSMRDLPDLVETITRNNKIDESRDFAASVQSTLYQRLRPVNRALKNLGVKQAPFMVLVDATMPAVLAEIAFMTNRQEAALLKTEKYRQQIAEALVAGIMRYARGLKKTPAVTASP